MKKLLILLLLVATPAWAADTKTTALTELTTEDGSDLLYIVDDPAGTPTSKKITVDNLFDAIDTSAELRTYLTDESGTGAAIFAAGDVGAATATTPSADDNDTSVATTAYVQGEINGAGGTNLTCGSGTCNVDDAFLVNDANDTMSGSLAITGTIQIQGLDCTGNANGGALTTSATGAVICSDDDSTAGSGNITLEIDGASQSTSTGTLDFDGTDFTITESPTDDFDIAIADDGHNHTTTSISGLDVSDDLNLIGGTNITLTGDTLNVDDAFLANDGDTGTGVYDFGGATSLEIVNGTAPTIDADGEIAVDTTSGQLIYYDTPSVRTLTGTMQVSFALLDPVDADSPLIKKAPFNMTITDIDCIVDPADSAESVVIDIRECNSTGDSCTTVDATITCDNDGAADDGAFTNATIDSGDWINLDIGTVTGTVSGVYGTVIYTVDRQ